MKRCATRSAIAAHLGKSTLRSYFLRMNIIRRTLDIDADTDARLREMADERGQDVAAPTQSVARSALGRQIDLSQYCIGNTGPASRPEGRDTARHAEVKHVPAYSHS